MNATEMVKVLVGMLSQVRLVHGRVDPMMGDRYRRDCYEALHAATDAGLVSEGQRHALSMFLISKNVAHTGAERESIVCVAH